MVWPPSQRLQTQTPTKSAESKLLLIFSSRDWATTLSCSCLHLVSLLELILALAHTPLVDKTTASPTTSALLWVSPSMELSRLTTPYHAKIHTLETKPTSNSLARTAWLTLPPRVSQTSR